MSYISLEKPIKTSIIFEAKGTTNYCSDSLSVFLLLNGTIIIEQHIYTAGELLIVPPFKDIKLISQDLNYIELVKFNNALLLSFLDNPIVFEHLHDSISSISLKELAPIIEDLIDSDDSFYSFVQKMNELFPVNESIYIESELITTTGTSIINYINENLHSPLSLQDVSSAIGVTPQYLSSFFKKNFALTFKDFVNAKKINHCLPYLKYTDLPDETLALMFGFASATAFQNAFVNTTGNPPSSYRSDKNSILLVNIPVENQVDKANYPTLFSGNLQAIAVPDNTPPENLSVEEITKFDVTRFSQNWKNILNIGSPGNMLSSEFRNHIIYTQKDICFIYGRITNILQITVEHIIKGEPLYDFEDVFKILDFLIELKLTPFLTFKFEPGIRYTFDFLRIFSIFIRSCYNRYSKSLLSNWRFELSYNYLAHGTNKPTIRQYLESYASFYNIVKEVIPTALVGGPGFNALASITDFDTTLKNAAEQNIIFDFATISIYANSSSDSSEAKYAKGDRLLELTTNCTQLIRKFNAEIPIYVTDYGFYYGANNYINDSTFIACMILWFVINNINLVDGMGYQLMSDSITPNNNYHGLLYGGPGMLNYLGLKKAAYYAHIFLNEMGQIRLNNDAGVLLTCKNKYCFRALVFHAPNLSREAFTSNLTTDFLSNPGKYFSDVAEKTVNLTITDPVPGRYLIKEYRINSTSGDLQSAYSRLLDISDFSQADISCLDSISRPSASISTLDVSENQPLVWPIKIKSLEIVLVLIDYNRR